MSQTAQDIVREGVATLQSSMSKPEAIRDLLGLLSDANKLRLFDELGETFLRIALGEK